MKRIISMLLICILLLQALPLTGFAAEQDTGSGIVVENDTYYIQTFEHLKELASGTYEDYIFVSFKDLSTFTISESLTLPEKLYFEALEGEIIIPAGVTFRAGSNFLANKLTVKGTGYFDYLQIHHTLSISGTLSAGCIELCNDAASLDRELSDVIIGANNINKGTTKDIWISPRITKVAELETCIQKAKAVPSGYRYGVALEGGDFVIDRSITFPDNLQLAVIAGSLTIAKGCTLIPDGGLISFCPLTVHGTLVNNDRIDLCNYSDSVIVMLTIASGGSYSGEGEICISCTGDYKAAISGIDLDNYTVSTYLDGATLSYKIKKVTAKASNVESSGKPKISWNEAYGAVEYQVYRATSKSGTYKLMKTTTKTSYTNTSAEAGKTYYYKVRGVTESGKKLPFSDIVSRTCDLPQPKAKTTNVASSGKIKVSWNKIDGAKEYKVYRATSEDGEYKLMKTTTSTSYTNTSAKAGTKYYYKVRAIHSKSSANSAYSEVVGRYCDLARPTVTISLKNGDPKLSWKEVSGAEEYEIYRATSKSGTYKLMKTTTKTSYTNTSAKAGKTYYYKVKAIHSKSSANSAYSSVKSITAK